jgi:hypothetical protein
MDIIEIEQSLGYLRNALKEESTQIDEAKILICKAQNIIQKWIEKNYAKDKWKHINMEYKSQSFF